MIDPGHHDLTYSNFNLYCYSRRLSTDTNMLSQLDVNGVSTCVVSSELPCIFLYLAAAGVDQTSSHAFAQSRIEPSNLPS